MNFWKKYSYVITKLWLNQIAIALFGVALAFASDKGGRTNLLFYTSVFAVVFYLFLQYAVMWEVGAKDGISDAAHGRSRRLWRGFLIGTLANSLNLLLAVLVLTKEFTGVTALSAAAQFIALMTEGMYQGILTKPLMGLRLHDYSWVYFAITVPAVVVSGVAYIIGQYNLHLTNILIPKNEDVKNNGRPS